MNEKALKYLYGLLKDTRIALGKAERKPNVDLAELDNLRSKIDMLEYSAAAVLAYEEPKRGEWGKPEIVGYDGIRAIYAAPCSLCGKHTKEYKPRYCQNCGAMMDGGKDK